MKRLPLVVTAVLVLASGVISCTQTPPPPQQQPAYQSPAPAYNPPVNSPPRDEYTEQVTDDELRRQQLLQYFQDVTKEAPSAYNPPATQDYSQRETVQLYPTIHNEHDDFGLPIYEMRENRLYPTIHNNYDDFGLPAYEIRHGKVYPTIHNQFHDYGLPAYEIRGDKLYPTIHNDFDDFGLPVYDFE